MHKLPAFEQYLKAFLDRAQSNYRIRAYRNHLIRIIHMREDVIETGNSDMVSET